MNENSFQQHVDFLISTSILINLLFTSKDIEIEEILPLQNLDMSDHFAIEATVSINEKFYFGK